MCRNCGAIVGAGQSECAVCDTPLNASAEPAMPSAPDPETLRFARAVISRPATFTFIFIIANVFIFLLMTLTGSSEDPLTLRAFGAKYNSLINAGEWWRLITPVFLHIGPIHLIVNMYGLFILGPYVEKLYGSARFVVFWALTGVAGVAASYFASMYEMNDGVLGRFLFRGGDGPSAGASGALFGLIGILFVFGIKFRNELPEGFKRAFGTGMLPTILINLFIGYAIPFIDNAAHLGGFFAGAFIALFVGYKRPGQRAGVAVVWHILQAAALVVVAAGFAMVALKYSGPPPRIEGVAERLLPGEPDVKKYLDATNNEGTKAFVEIFNGNTGAAVPALEKLEKTPSISERADALRDELKMLITRARDINNVVVKDAAGRRERSRQEKILLDDFQSWQQSFNEWVKTEGSEFGIREVSSPNTEEEIKYSVRRTEDGD